MIRPGSSWKRRFSHGTTTVLFGAALLGCLTLAVAADPPPTSYSPVVMKETFQETVDRMTVAKAEIDARQQALLEERYDMSDAPAEGVTMSRGKAVQGGVRAKLPTGTSWDDLANMTPDQVRESGKWPKAFLSLPHPNHAEGGMVFPKFHIDEIKNQEQRDLTRFDLDFDLPDHFLPEFPPPIFLTTRPDLGRRFAGQTCNDHELLRTVRWDPQSETDRGLAALGDTVSATAVQSDD